MTTININFLRTELGEIANQGEHGRTQLDFNLPEEFRAVDYVNVEFRKGNKDVEIIEGLVPTNDHIIVPLDQNITNAAGRINIQVVGYKIEQSEITQIIKSPIVCGSIHRSLNILYNYDKEGLSERFLAFLTTGVNKLENLQDPQVNLVNENTYSGELLPYQVLLINPEVEALSITITGLDNSENYNYPEYLIDFVVGDIPTTLALPENIQYSKRFDIVPNKHYQISIRNNIALCCSAD